MDEDTSKRAFFYSEDGTSLSSEDEYIRPDVPLGQLALTGPAARNAGGRLPVRGDLAHIRLAGSYFVPHYAAPMALRVGQAGAVLRVAPLADAEEVCTLGVSSTIDVLDIAGGWCWGELGDGGPVSYVEQAALEAPAP